MDISIHRKPLPNFTSGTREENKSKFEQEKKLQEQKKSNDEKYI